MDAVFIIFSIIGALLFLILLQRFWWTVRLVVLYVNDRSGSHGLIGDQKFEKNLFSVFKKFYYIEDEKKSTGKVGAWRDLFYLFWRLYISPFPEGLRWRETRRNIYMTLLFCHC